LSTGYTRQFHLLRWLAAPATLLLSSCKPATPPTPWWQNAVFYEVFVRSYSDSNGDGIGDLPGLTAHLDELNDGNPNSTSSLHVDALWLMPIFPSPSYHGYDVTDYESINPDYGTLADFDALVAAAHARGIKIILDMVLNHTSSEHPWFLNSQQGPTATERDWYDWLPSDPYWNLTAIVTSDPWYPLNNAYYYGFFSSAMPDLNHGNADVQAQLMDAMTFWLQRGVDGFRFDAVRYFFYYVSGNTPYVVDQPQTYAYLQQILTTLQSKFPEAYMVAEVWAGESVESTYLGSVQHAFAFDEASAMVGSGQSSASTPIINQLRTSRGYLTQADGGLALTFEAPFLSNHDQVRVMRQLGNDTMAARASAATLFAMPGTPFVYYGEDLGMMGGPNSATTDLDKRTPYPWSSTAPNYGFTTSASGPWYSAPEDAGVDLSDEQGDSSSLWSLYRKLISVRHGQAALSGDDAVVTNTTGGGDGLMALVRSNGSDRTLFLVNYETGWTGPFSVNVSGTPTVVESEGLSGAPSSSGGQVQVSNLAARGFAFISLQ